MPRSLKEIDKLVLDRIYIVYQYLGRNRRKVIGLALVFCAVINYFGFFVPGIGQTHALWLIFGYLWLTLLPAAFVYFGTRFVLGAVLRGYRPDGEAPPKNEK